MGIFDRDYMQEPGSTGNMIRQMSAVKMIIILNLSVFVAWYLLPNDLMRSQFMVSWSALTSGKIWTLLTAAFSHYDLFHFFINMLVFLSFAPVLEARWGKRRFLYFYLGSAVFSSLTKSRHGWPLPSSASHPEPFSTHRSSGHTWVPLPGRVK